MKSFFEFLGFISTALISGFLVFTYIGHQKNAGKSDMKEMVTAYNAGESTYSDIEPVSPARNAAKEKKKNMPKNAVPAPQAEKKTLATESVAITDKLKSLYADEAFVAAAVKKWKNHVEEASEAHLVRPQLLLSNVIIKSYLGDYSYRDFKRDVSEHAGDQATPLATAGKSYDYAWSVAKIAQQYDLGQYFEAPVKTASAKAPAYKAVTAPQKATASKQKPVASVSPAEAGFREMVAKEEGFSSWQGLQRLGDLETKKNAERRVKTLMSAARVR
jgi:hypothetical protein